MKGLLGHAMWIIPAIILASSIALVIAARFRRVWWLPIPPVILLIVWAFAGPGILAYTFGGGFGLGTMLSMLTVPMDCFSSIILVIGGIATFLKLKDSDERWKRALLLYSVCALIVLALPIVPVAGGSAIRNRCDKLNREAAETLLLALETYRKDNGAYPESPDQLVPEYVAELPALHCFANRAQYAPDPSPGSAKPAPPLELVECSETVTLLVAPDLAGGWPQRYNMATKKWSKISFLDGVCSFIE